MKKMRLIKTFLLTLLFLTFTFSQQNKEFISKLDTLAEKTREAFNVPGISVAIVKDSTVFLVKGYGVTDITSENRVTPETVFGIASNTKAFTAAGLAILVDEKKLKWDDKVIDYLPEFETYDPYVTREFTIKDLLVHHSGLTGGYGDLMLWPASDFTRSEIIERIKYLKPKYSFRTRFGYSNIHYIVAGEVIRAVTGKSWEDFTRERIVKALDMKNTYMGVSELPQVKNLAKPHVELEKKLIQIEIENTDVTGPAATIYSTAGDITNWMLTQLNNGTSPDGKEIFSSERSYEMWTPVTVLGGKRNGDFPSAFSGYGLGWGIREYKGNRIISHTGGLPGMVSKITLIPEQKLGIAIFTNQQSGSAFNALTYFIMEHFFNKPHEDYVETYKTRNEMRENRINKRIENIFNSVKKESKPSLELKKYAGTYTDD
ncbi:MAG: serine hydrolase domain-containing protein [Rhodothermaceae bacterium]